MCLPSPPLPTPGGAIVILDNTWGAGHYFKAFAMGCDVSIQAATKYIVGHSDAMLGTVTCNEATWGQFKEAYETMGLFAGPDDMYLALRGMRTLDVRLERHMRSAITVAEWLRGRPEVETVLHPCPDECPRPLPLEARLHRRLRAVLRGSEAGLRESRCRHAGRPRAFQHGIFLGRL
jgi:cystathionine beta-lyase/cystathionine gamma-synthase